MKIFRFLSLILGLCLALTTSLSVIAQSADILKYPAIPSPNICTENWGVGYFQRSNGYCQPCETVSQEYKQYYNICEFTEEASSPVEAEPFFVSCYSDKTGRRAYRECVTEAIITKAEIVREYGESQCRFDITWGFFEDTIWTSRGCVAKFEVCYLDRPCHLDSIAAVPVTPPAPVQPVCTPYKPGGWISYRIQAGDSLSALARRTGSYTETLRKVNCIKDPSFIVSGTYIYLPRFPDPIFVPPVIVNPPKDNVIIVPIDTDRPEEVDPEGEGFISNASFLGTDKDDGEEDSQDEGNED